MSTPPPADRDHVPDGDDDGRFRLLFSAIDEGYCLCEIIVDGAGTPVDYRFLETNPIFEEMTGLADATGQTARALVPELEDHWIETYGRVALEGEHLRFEQGSEAMGRWFDVFAMPVHPPGRFAIVFKDETVRHETEARLRRSEARHRGLAEQNGRIARRLQQAMLPDEVVQHADLEIVAHYRAAEDILEVGGDWYDTYEWPDGRIGLVVGDVVGHDLEAAIAMGQLRVALSALAPLTDGSPAAMLEALGECARGPNGTPFLTASCVVVDPATGTVVGASAGHLPVLVVQADGTTTWINDQPAPPLGLAPSERPVEGHAQLAPGATLVLYTDGLVERRSEVLTEGLARLEAQAARLVAAGSADLGLDLVAAMASHSPAGDDVVVVTVRYRPDP